MGQQNMVYTDPMLYAEPRQLHHHHHYHHSEPCMVSYLPENHGQLPYMIAQFNSEHCNTFMMPSPCTGVFSISVNHGGQPVQTVHSPWFDRQGAFSWNRAHGVPYLQGCINGYQVAAMNRNSTAFIHPPPIIPHQGPHTVYHPPPPSMPPVQLPSTLHRHSTRYPFQNGADPGPRFVGPALPHGVRVYTDYRRELMIDSTARHRSFPHLRVLPEDELVVLGEQIVNVDSCLSDSFISNHLKTRTFRPHSKDLMPSDEEPNFCVICQMEFEDQENIGLLDCRHEYHVECIKKWLIMKNNCPICKSTALN